jgi:hypothetical protein
MRVAGTLLLFLTLALAACDGPTHSNYYGTDRDPLPGGGDPPTLALLEPDRGFAGDQITISGDGFRADTSETMVNIGTAVAEIVSVTENDLTVIAPSNESGLKRVRVAIWGSEEWSNEMMFNYLSDFVLFEYDTPTPKGVAVDAEGDLYISSGANSAVYRIDAEDSTMSTYATLPVTGPMDFGPGGDLYVVTSNGIDRVTPGGTVENVVSLSGVVGFDWDENGDLYVLVSNRIHRLSGGTLTEAATVTQGQRLRVFDGHVYVTELSRARVSRFPITGDGLGELEIYFNAGTPVAGLDIDADGNVYAGGFVRDYVLQAAPDRVDDSDIGEIPNEEDRANPFRKVTNRLGVIYLHGSVMYLIQDDPAGKVWRIFIGEQSAPRYGRQ